MRSPRRAQTNYREFVKPLPERRSRQAGGALHGLRHSLLPHGMPGQQSDPGLEQPRLSRASGARRWKRCTRPTISRNSPAASAPRPARRAARSTSRTIRSRSKPSNARSSIAAGKRAGFSRWSRRKRPARRSRWSAPARRAWPARSSWRAPGTRVTLFEKNDRIGGLLRYGIPDFKMEKHLIDRRLVQMQAEGVEFRTGVEVGVAHPVSALLADYRRGGDGGRRGKPARSSKSRAANLTGIHFAMDFLTQQNKRDGGRR